MSDVLAQEPQRTPTWVWVVGALVAAAVVGLAIDRAARPASTAALPSPSPSPSASPLPDPGSAGSACGGDVDLPIVEAAPRPTGTRLRLLVGGRDLRVVDVDAATTSVLPWHDPGRVVMQLGRDGGRVLTLLQKPCGNNGLGGGTVASIDPRTGARTVLGPGDQLLPGSPASVTQLDPEGRWSVGRVGPGVRRQVPGDWVILAAAGPSYFIAVYPPASADAPPVVGLGDPATGRLTSFGRGTPVLATADELLWTAGDCAKGCLLSRTTRDGVTTAERVPAMGCCVEPSPDGRWLAFPLLRSSGRLGEHPGPPKDVAVLDLETHRVRRIPGLVLPTKAGLTLTWSADSRWLVAGADLGTQSLVLLWTPGAQRWAQVPMGRVGGGTAGPPALLVL